MTATGASRSRAYELMAQLAAILPTIARPVGRPAGSPPEMPVIQQTAITRAVLRYVLRHPGCVHGGAQRLGYNDGFRQFVVTLRAQHEEIALDLFATLVEVPLGTLKTWLAPSASPVTRPNDSPKNVPENPPGNKSNITLAQIETVLAAWKTWDGTFVDFASHVRNNLRVPFGRQLVARILEHHGARPVQRRPGRSPDEIALRGAFETFFPGAQWVGDGKTVQVKVGDQTFEFNLELQVDADAGAYVGLSVRDTEDSEAVIESFEDGIATTGAAPMAELLDNKPSNHTPEVDAVLKSKETIRIRATTKRPQNKAHVEGAFGLFSQQVPPIEINENNDPRSIAKELLLLVALTWARATNCRPRVDRDGRSRIELYRETATDEQIAEARRALEERCRKQERARLTREARQRPEIRALLDSHFERLGLIDPERSVRIAIANYPLDAIIDGIAIFDGKQTAGTLPEGADARYLLGIVRNVAAKREGECITETLIKLRSEARDQALAALETERQNLCASSNGILEVINNCVKRALDAVRTLDRTFWLQAIVETINCRGIEPEERERLVRAASQTVHASFRVTPQERQDALRFLVDRLVPLD